MVLKVYLKQTRLFFLKSRVRVLTFILFIILLLYASAVRAENSFALVELFTSEGCSSCPSADKVLAQLENLNSSQNLPIYALGFHVHYWDYLGWKDRFSSNEYSQRQRKYAAVFGKNPYTPQMIVNGKYEFGGYREDLAKENVERVLKQPSNVTLSLNFIKVEENRAILSYSCDVVSSDFVLNLALVETGLSTNVKSGENRGKQLIHVNAVRRFLSVHPDKEGKVTVELPDNMHLDSVRIIGYLQNTKNYEIVSADQVSL